MNQALLTQPSPSLKRVSAALAALRAGQGVIVLDAEDREHEGDIIFAAEMLTVEQMALTIRYGSGIVCLAITEAKRQQLAIPMMVTHNSSPFKTAFTVSIEAAVGVTTGVSAADRVTTIRAAIADDAKPADLHYPGHVFPLCAREGGVIVRPGHTEASVDLMQLAGLKPAAVLCELMNDNGSMARGGQVIVFAKQHGMCVLSIADIIEYRMHTETQKSVS